MDKEGVERVERPITKPEKKVNVWFWRKKKSNRIWKKEYPVVGSNICSISIVSISSSSIRSIGGEGVIV